MSAPATGLESPRLALVALIAVTAVWGVTFVQASLAMPTFRTGGLRRRVRPR